MTKRVEKNEKIVKKLEKEERTEKNKIRGKKFVKLVTLFLILFTALFYYMRFIEPTMLFVNEEKVENIKLPKSFSGLKVLQFSDIHYLVTTNSTYLEKMIKKINLTKPDIVVFTGDLLDKSISYTDDDYDTLTSLLKRIDANISKYYIKGEEDYNEKIEYIMEKADFINLTNKSDVIISKENEKIQINGLGSKVRNDFKIEESFNDLNHNIYTISLFHEADMIDEIRNKNIDLALSGHSHGNQINLGFFTNIFSKEYAKNYNKGSYQLGNTLLYVSSGVGNSSENKLRFLTPPSISLFRLVQS